MIRELMQRLIGFRNSKR